LGGLRRAPGLSAGSTRRGASWMKRGGRGAGSPFCRLPPKAAARRTSWQDSQFARRCRPEGEVNGCTECLSGSRVAFSLDTFFWRRKRKYLARGCENPHSNKPSRSDSFRAFRSLMIGSVVGWTYAIALPNIPLQVSSDSGAIQTLWITTCPMALGAGMDAQLTVSPQAANRSRWPNQGI